VAPRRKAQQIDLAQIQLTDHVLVEVGDVTVAPRPVEAGRLAEPRLQGNDQLTNLGKLFIPAHPTGITHFIVQYDQGLALAAPNQDEFTARNVDSFFFPSGQCLPLAKVSLKVATGRERHVSFEICFRVASGSRPPPGWLSSPTGGSRDMGIWHDRR